MDKFVGSDGQVTMSEEEYVDALERIEQFWGAEAGTPEGRELDALVERVLQYEDEHFPMGSPRRRGRLRPEDFPADSGMTEERIQLYGEGVDRAAAHFRASRARLAAYGGAVYRAHQRFHANMDRLEASAVKWRPMPACPVCGTERMRRNWYGIWECRACNQNEWTPDGAQQFPRDRSAVDAMDHFMVVCQAVSEVRMVLSRLKPHHLNQLQCELLELLEASQVLLLGASLDRSEQRSVLDEYLEQTRPNLAEACESPVPRQRPEDD
ncbi:50S ribosomal protein L37Ae [compost metagenome]